MKLQQVKKNSGALVVLFAMLAALYPISSYANVNCGDSTPCHVSNMAGNMLLGMGAGMANSAAIGDSNNAQQVSVLGGHAAMQVALEHLMTSKGYAHVGMEIKANQALELAYAASDDLANAITYAIIHEYENKTKDQMIAELLEEGRSYGYVDVDGNFLSQNEPEDAPDTFFSFFPKAHADTPGHNNVIYATGEHAAGHAMDLSGITGSKYGVSMPAGQLPLKQDMGRGAIFSAKVSFVHGLPGNKSCGTNNRSAQCNEDLFEHIHAIATHGDELSKKIHRIVYNSRMNCSGCTTTTENNVPSFFLISAAHASTASSATAVDATASNKQTADANLAKAYQQMGYLTGVDQPSPLEGQCAEESANENATALRSGAGNVSIEETDKETHSKNPACKWHG